MTVRREGGEEADEAEAAVAAAEKFFEPGVGEAKPEGEEAAEEPAKA